MLDKLVQVFWSRPVTVCFNDAVVFCSKDEGGVQGFFDVAIGCMIEEVYKLDQMGILEVSSNVLLDPAGDKKTAAEYGGSS